MTAVEANAMKLFGGTMGGAGACWAGMCQNHHASMFSRHLNGERRFLVITALEHHYVLQSAVGDGCAG